MLSRMSRHLVGGFAYFAEDGSTIDASLVGVDAAPDFAADLELVPSLGCIEQVSPSVEEESHTFDCPSATGGYERSTERNVLADYLDMQLTKTNEIVQRLTWGVADEIADDTEQEPFEVRDRRLLGWLHLLGRLRGGDVLVKADLWVECRLQENPPWSKEPTRPALRFQVIGNALNGVAWPAPA